jgi:isochorismate synthase EntC
MELDKQRLLRAAISGSARSEVRVKKVLDERKLNDLDHSFKTQEEQLSAVNHIIRALQQSGKLSEPARRDIDYILETEILL